MTAYQFTPGGIVEGLGLVQDVGDDPAKTHGAVVLELPVVQQRPAVQRPPSPAQPFNVLKLARNRVREIKLELRRLKSLQAELDQLQRLLAASKTYRRKIE